MGLFSTRMPPTLPQAPDTYDANYLNRFMGVLRLYFNDISAVQQVNIAKLNINISTLPTEADLATLRSGDIYRDTTASHVLKVKP